MSTLPKGVPQRLLIFNAVNGWLDRVDWEYALSSDRSLAPGARILGINIILHINPKDRDCHPSQRTLAARLGCTPRTIVRHIKLLERTGWLVIRRWAAEKREGIHRRANVYRPTIPAALIEAIKVTAVSPSSEELSDISRQNKVTPVSPQYSNRINKKERGFGEEKGEVRKKELALEDKPIPEGRVFVEMDSPEWDAWRLARGKSLRNYTVRIGGKLKWGCFCRSAWPTSELKPKLNGGSAPLVEAVG